MECLLFIFFHCKPNKNKQSCDKRSNQSRVVRRGCSWALLSLEDGRSVSKNTKFAPSFLSCEIQLSCLRHNCSWLQHSCCCCSWIFSKHSLRICRSSSNSTLTHSSLFQSTYFRPDGAPINWHQVTDLCWYFKAWGETCAYDSWIVIIFIPFELFVFAHIQDVGSGFPFHHLLNYVTTLW